MSQSIQKELQFDQLPRFQKRRFVPEGAKLIDASEVKAIYEQLLKRALTSSRDLEQWILDRSELEAAIRQEGTVLYIRMTCQTDDQQRAQAYKNFVETIEPLTKTLDNQLNQRYLKVVNKFALPKERYQVYDRAIQTDVKLFKEENIPLQTQLELLSQEYQTVCGAMTVNFEGQERTLPEMGKYLFEPNRDLRERAWRAMAQRRLKNKEKLEDLFDKMFQLRNKIALNAGFSNFCDYQFQAFHRFDYSPEDCKKYHQTIERLLVPLRSNNLNQRRQKMKLESLRPWDLNVDPLARPPLKPFKQIEELQKGCLEIFNQIDKNFGQQFSQMLDLKLLDLSSRKGKAPGGYQSTLNEARKPFIFMNAVGLDDDVRTLLHEAGHAFHALACAHDPLLEYRHGPMEFNEVASMGMELLAGEHISIFYNPQEAKRSQTAHLKDIIYILIWVAIVDAFQHWIYENPGQTQEERREAWIEIHERFNGDLVDWQGLEEERSFLWHRQLHIFEYPFYYIEYGIAQLGALQLWFNAKKDWGRAIGNYRQALSLGGARPLPELYKTAGIKFDFSEKTIVPLIEALKNELT